MTERALPKRRGVGGRTVIFTLAAIASGAVVFGSQAKYFTHPHPPTTDLLLDAPAVIQVHLAAATSAVLLGLLQIILPKGTFRHRLMGWSWVGLMLVVAGTSLFIRTLGPGLSVVHILTAMTLIGLPLGVYFARKHDPARHGFVMTSLYTVGLLVGGLFNFIPGRLLWKALFG